LLADEDAFVRDRLRLFLEQDAGMHVCGEADNGLEAVRIAKRCKPDLVIMGLRMPEMNGAETATAIRHALPHTRIVIFTSFSDWFGKSMARISGVDLVVPKSEGMTGLTKALQKLLAG